MASDNSRIIKPLFPSLCHLASINLAVPLFQRFGRATVDKASTELQNGITGASADSEALKGVLMSLDLPSRLKVLQAVRGIHCSINYWKRDHSDILKLTGGRYTLKWRPDGSIDTMRIVLSMVENKDIGIVDRFEIACKFGLVHHILNLWKGVRVGVRRKHVQANENWLVMFWVWWLKLRCSTNSNCAIASSLSPPKFQNCLTLKGRQSSFFTLLQPMERQRFLSTVVFSTDDDFRFCLQAMTGEEQEKLLSRNALAVLRLYLKWPLRFSFLEVADQLWDFVDATAFAILLYNINYYHIDEWEDFDFRGLFVDFWERSPPRLRKSARKNEVLMRLIEMYLNKDKIDYKERKNSKKG